MTVISSRLVGKKICKKVISSRLGYFVEGGQKKIRESNFQCRRNGKSAGSEKSEKRPSQDGKILTENIKFFLKTFILKKFDFGQKTSIFFRKVYQKGQNGTQPELTKCNVIQIGNS